MKRAHTMCVCTCTIHKHTHAYPALNATATTHVKVRARSHAECVNIYGNDDDDDDDSYDDGRCELATLRRDAVNDIAFVLSVVVVFVQARKRNQEHIRAHSSACALAIMLMYLRSKMSERCCGHRRFTFPRHINAARARATRARTSPHPSSSSSSSTG